MKHYNIPLNLKSFIIVDSKTPTTIEHVETDIAFLLTEMVDRLDEFINSDEYDKLADDILAGHIVPKAPLNGFGRSIGLKPLRDFSFQNANMSEMWRTLILNAMMGYIESSALFNVMEHCERNHLDITPTTIMNEWASLYTHLKKPSIYVVKAHCHRWTVKGHREATKPSAFPCLPLYSPDMYFCSKVVVDDDCLRLSFKLPSSNLTTLEFKLPESQRFTDNVVKITRPVIQYSNGQLVFHFTVQKKIPVTRSNPHVLGVDLGKVEPFVATVVRNNSTFSSPYHAPLSVNSLSKRISSLYQLREQLQAKAHLNEQRHRYAKAGVLFEEEKRVGNKISRLKHQQSILIAHSLIQIADAENADIIFEDLRWTSGAGTNLSGSWNHSGIQRATEHLSQQKGIVVKKVSAKNTSQQCSRCGKTVRHLNNRRTICNSCRNQLNRDTNASRNIASRGLKRKDLLSFKQSNSTHTRVSYVSFPSPWNSEALTPEMVTLFQGSILLHHLINVKSIT